MELYKASKKSGAGEKQLNDWIKYAQNLADNMLEKFWDEKSGGLYSTYDGESNVFLRYKSAIDGALPSANALAVIALNELAEVMNQNYETSESAKKYSDYAKKIVDCFSRAITENPFEYLSLIVANSLWKPFKQKTEPKTEKVVPTDEELNREEIPATTEQLNQDEQSEQEQRRSARISRRTSRENTERRATRSRRTSRGR